jgi:two-component system, cell cycle sensor histidine kinase and response regulator CckA
MQSTSKILMVWGVGTTAALITLAMTTTLAERERAEAALTAAARDYQNLVDCTPAAIVRYTTDGTLTFVNEPLCQLLGMPRELLMGQPVRDFIPKMPLAEEETDFPVAEPVVGPGRRA